MGVPNTKEMKTSLPLYWYLRRYGLRDMRWWKAIMGCDISVKSNGIVIAGRGSLLKVMMNMKSLDQDNVEELTNCRFAANVRSFSRPSCHFIYNVDAVALDSERVSSYFNTGDTYYENSANIHSSLEV